jgi:hypothetical protein
VQWLDERDLFISEQMLYHCVIFSCEAAAEMDFINGSMIWTEYVRFVASAYVGVVEWWFMNEKPIPHQELAEQLGTLLERICN